MPIEAFVEARGIKSLFHFTRVDNLPSILKSGLLPKEVCAKAGIQPVINDEYRFDCTDAVCASISFPNYKMFYRLRCNNPQAEWVVLKLKCSLLWRTRCAFCTTNAADTSVSGIPIAQRAGLSSLQSLFEDFDGKERSNLNIPDHFTTNPQAEILLLDGAKPDDIKGIYFHRSRTKDAFQAAYNHVQCHLNGGYFDPRSDYQHWQ